MAKFEITWLEDRSDEAVLAEIRRVAALVPDRRLTMDKFNSHSKIKSTAVRERFGSWSEATSAPCHTDAILSSTARARSTFARMASTFAVHVNERG